MRKKFPQEYSDESLALHIYDVFKNLKGVECENN